MASRFYVLPMVGRYPRYLSGLAARQPLVRWFGTDAPSCLVCPDDLGEIELGDTTDPGVVVLPRVEDIDCEIGAALGRVSADLARVNLPTERLTKTMSYRHLLRFLVGVMRFSQRYRYRLTTKIEGDSIFPLGVGPQTPVNQLAPEHRVALRETIEDCGLDPLEVIGGKRMSEVLQRVGEHGAAPLNLGLAKL